MLKLIVNNLNIKGRILIKRNNWLQSKNRWWESDRIQEKIFGSSGFKRRE